MPTPGVVAAASIYVPTPATQAWVDYSPLSGLTEAEKTAYWAGKGVMVALPGTRGDSAAALDEYGVALENYKTDNAATIAAVQRRVADDWTRTVEARDAAAAIETARDAAEQAAENSRRLFAAAGAGQFLNGDEARAGTNVVGRDVALVPTILDPKSILAREAAARLVPAGARVDVNPNSINALSITRADGTAENDAGRLPQTVELPLGFRLPLPVAIALGAGVLYLLMRAGKH